MSDPVHRAVIRVETPHKQERVCYACGRGNDPEDPEPTIKAIVVGWHEDPMGGVVYGVMQGGSTRIALCVKCRAHLEACLHDVAVRG